MAIINNFTCPIKSDQTAGPKGLNKKLNTGAI